MRLRKSSDHVTIVANRYRMAACPSTRTTPSTPTGGRFARWWLIVALVAAGVTDAEAQPVPSSPPSVPTPASAPSGEAAEASSAAPTAPHASPFPPLTLDEFHPKSQLVVPSHPRDQAAFTVVDVHTHFYYKLRHNAQALDDFVAVMDRHQIAVCASLDGMLGPQLDEHLAFLWSKYRDRFVVFTHVNWRGDGASDDPATWACHQPRFAKQTAAAIHEAVGRGVSGLKVFKQLGLSYRNPDGSLIAIDDPRWDPIWEACGDAGIPVIIHTADPAAFFEPVDERNERYEELSRHPNWSFHGDQFPSRESLLEARNRVIARHPKTQFIGAHIANHSENLAVVSEWLERYPNLWVEPASRISELGRQPFTAREFLIRHADRLLFGTDGPWPEARLRYYWRFFETRDEYFPYSEKVPPPQGLWNIDGVGLPDEVLKKLYHANAAKLIPGVAERLEKYAAEPHGSEATP